MPSIKILCGRYVRRFNSALVTWEDLKLAAREELDGRDCRLHVQDGDKGWRLVETEDDWVNIIQTSPQNAVIRLVATAPSTAAVRPLSQSFSSMSFASLTQSTCSNSEGGVCDSTEGFEDNVGREHEISPTTTVSGLTETTTDKVISALETKKETRQEKKEDEGIEDGWVMTGSSVDSCVELEGGVGGMQVTDLGENPECETVSGEDCGDGVGGEVEGKGSEDGGETCETGAEGGEIGCEEEEGVEKTEVAQNVVSEGEEAKDGSLSEPKGASILVVGPAGNLVQQIFGQPIPDDYSASSDNSRTHTRYSIGKSEILTVTPFSSADDIHEYMRETPFDFVIYCVGALGLLVGKSDFRSEIPQVTKYGPVIPVITQAERLTTSELAHYRHEITEFSTTISGVTGIDKCPIVSPPQIPAIITSSEIRFPWGQADPMNPHHSDITGFRRAISAQISENAVLKTNPIPSAHTTIREKRYTRGVLMGILGVLLVVGLAFARGAGVLLPTPAIFEFSVLSMYIPSLPVNFSNLPSLSPLSEYVTFPANILKQVMDMVSTNSNDAFKGNNPNLTSTDDWVSPSSFYLSSARESVRSLEQCESEKTAVIADVSHLTNRLHLCTTNFGAVKKDVVACLERLSECEKIRQDHARTRAQLRECHMISDQLEVRVGELSRRLQCVGTAVERGAKKGKLKDVVGRLRMCAEGERV